MISKTEIREIIKQKFTGLDENDKKDMDNKIRKNIYKLDGYTKAKTIFSYFSKDKEVDTLELITHSLNIGKKVGVPLIKDNHELETRKINDLNDLGIGKYSILEPDKNLEIINSKDLELLFIPGLAFGICGERLGRGGGYFDRFLARSYGLKIGLAYEFQIFDSLPTLNHDVKMDLIITNERIISHV